MSNEELSEVGKMAPESLYEHHVFVVGYDRVSSVLQLAFLTHPDTDQFRNAYKIAIDAAERKGARYWLTDATQIKTMLPENQAWLAEKMGPLLKSQIKKFAIVMDPACFVMTSPSRVYDKVNQANEAPKSQGIKIHFDKESAFAWFSEG